MKRDTHRSIDALITLIHIFAAVLAAKTFLTLVDPENQVAALPLLLTVAAIGLVDLVLTQPLKRISRSLASRSGA